MAKKENMELRNWRELTADELAEIERLYPVTTNREIARRYRISVDAVQDYLAYPNGWKKDRKSVLIGNRGRKPITEKQEQYIIRHYSNTKNSVIMEKLGIGESTLHRIARKHGLRKTKQFMRKTRTEAREKAREVCLRYGVYEETRERMREKMNELSRRGEHIPGSFIKGQSNKDRLSPKRFRQLIEKSRATRNEMIRKERLRMRWGLPQKTRMLIFPEECRKSRKDKSIHRHLFRKFNYIVDRGDDNVYYDEQTERRPIMEANAHKYGLRILPLN